MEVEIVGSPAISLLMTFFLVIAMKMHEADGQSQHIHTIYYLSENPEREALVTRVTLGFGIRS
ncbi:hypothetical protein KSC_051970 [Ktedonobacter sp. SOSP1-52]|nr:hypothetical protein KSC_051970 [Ktedonobacter sp. SOSP1-52]